MLVIHAVMDGCPTRASSGAASVLGYWLALHVRPRGVHGQRAKESLFLHEMSTRLSVIDGARQGRMDDAHLHRLEELRRVHLHLSGAHAARRANGYCQLERFGGEGARSNRSAANVPGCISAPSPSLPCIFLSAARRVRRQTCTLRWGLPAERTRASVLAHLPGKRIRTAGAAVAARRLEHTHGDEFFQFLLWRRRRGVLRALREFVLQLLGERHGGGREEEFLRKRRQCRWG